MTDKPFRGFDYRLCQAIRNNKKALLAELPPPSLPGSLGHQQHEPLRRLIDAMFQFEKYARGAQQALGGVHVRKHFTCKAGLNHLSPYFDALPFLRKSLSMAHHVVRLMLECDGLLSSPTWQAILSIQGMHEGGFQDVMHPYVRNDRLPEVVKALPGISASFLPTNVLRLEFTLGGEGVKTLSRHFVCNRIGNLTLEQQLVPLHQYWTDMKHFILEVAKDPQDWPTPLDSCPPEVDEAAIERMVRYVNQV